MNTHELLAEIKACASSGLMGNTWPTSDRLANMQDALEQIVKLCDTGIVGLEKQKEADRMQIREEAEAREWKEQSERQE